MPTFSHSRIGTFETCPLQYKYHYLDKIKTKDQDTIEPFMGDLVHQTLEKLYKDLKFEKLLTLKELLEFYNKLWKENWHSNIKINKKEYTQSNYRKVGERCLTEYYNHYSPFNQGKTIGIETKDFISLDNDGKYKFHVRIDRLVDKGKGFYEVHDYKTNNSLKKQEDLDEDRQLAMYSLWVKKNFKDFKKVDLVWHYLAFDKELRSSRTEKQLQDLKKDVLNKIKDIEKTKDFKPSESALCDWCSFQHLCPLFKHEIELEEKTANEFLNDSGVKLVNQYAKIDFDLKEYQKQAESKLEDLKEALVQYCKKNNIKVVVGSNKKITVKEYDSISFPAKGTPEREKLEEVLKSIRKYNQVLTLDTSALKKALEEWDEKYQKKINKFKEVTKKYSVSIKKKD